MRPGPAMAALDHMRAIERMHTDVKQCDIGRLHSIILMHVHELLHDRTCRFHREVESDEAKEGMAGMACDVMWRDVTSRKAQL